MPTKSISAADANRQFSSLLRDVSRGAVYTVTSRGKPVAVISSAEQHQAIERQAAKRTLLSRLRSVKPVKVRKWTRDELYD